MLADKRYCYPLTITDFASRYLQCCDALAATEEVFASGKNFLQQQAKFERFIQLFAGGLARRAGAW